MDILKLCFVPSPRVSVIVGTCFVKTCQAGMNMIGYKQRKNASFTK